MLALSIRQPPPAIAAGRAEVLRSNLIAARIINDGSAS
jgi:hypothetical protein